MTTPTPTPHPILSADEINKLPDPIRAYIHFIETDCDPAGTIRENYYLRDENTALRIKMVEAVETVICAAVKMGTLVIRGHRHDDCIRNLIARKLNHEPIDQGFITSRNRYVGREEAMNIQRAAGKKSAYSHDGELHGTILFSEDLYMTGKDEVIL